MESLWKVYGIHFYGIHFYGTHFHARNFHIYILIYHFDTSK